MHIIRVFALGIASFALAVLGIKIIQANPPGSTGEVVGSIFIGAALLASQWAGRFMGRDE